MIVDKEKPISPPSDIAHNFTDAIHLDFHRGSTAKAGNVLDGDRVLSFERSGNHSYGGLDLVNPSLNFAHVGERDHEADDPMTAHAEVANVIKENDARRARCINGLAQ